MTESVEASAPRAQTTGRRNAVLLPLGLALAFSPTLKDLIDHWVSSPWSRYSITFVALLIWCVAREPGARRHRALGITLLSLGLLGQLLAARAAMLSLSRPTLAAAAIGLLLFRGATTPRVALLAVFAIPVPYSAMPFDLADAVFSAGASLLSPFDLDLELVFQWHYAGSGGERLRIDREYGGLIALTHFVGLACYVTLRRRLTAAPSALVVAGAALAAPVVQIAVTAAALTIFCAGSLSLATAVLLYAPWMLPLPVAIALAERTGRLSERPAP